jgi:site-specific recombinase XerD
MLSDYQNFGVVLRRTSAKREFPEVFDGLVQAFIESYQRRGLMAGSIRNLRLTMHHLTHFFVSQGISSPAGITTAHLNIYVKTTLCNFCKQRVAHELRTMRRCFIKYLHECGAIAGDISDSIIKVRNASQPSHLPSSFTSDEVIRILDAVDTSSPVGNAITPYCSSPQSLA